MDTFQNAVIRVFRILRVNFYPGTNFGDQSVRLLTNRMYLKTLQINCLFDYSFYKHGFLSR